MKRERGCDLSGICFTLLAFRLSLNLSEFACLQTIAICQRGFLRMVAQKRLVFTMGMRGNKRTAYRSQKNSLASSERILRRHDSLLHAFLNLKDFICDPSVGFTVHRRGC